MLIPVSTSMSANAAAASLPAPIIFAAVRYRCRRQVKSTPVRRASIAVHREHRSDEKEEEGEGFNKLASGGGGYYER